MNGRSRSGWNGDRGRLLRLAPAFACAAVGGGVLVGWMVDSARLKTISPGFSEMKANTALCFVLAGVALGLLDAGRAGRRVARGLSGLVALIGLLTLWEHAFGASLGIDQLLFDDTVKTVATPAPGRMGANTAFDFAVVGLSLLALDVERRGVRPAQVGALVAGVVAFASVLGYAFDVPRLEQGFVTKNVAPMALHTALAFLLLAAGLMAARPRAGVMRLARSPGAGGVLVRRLLLPVVALPALIGYAQLEGQRAGLYGVEEGDVLFTTSVILLLGILIWSTARTLEGADVERLESVSERERAERGQAKLEDQLRQAQKMEAIGRLAGGIAHDFNNLLTVIAGHSELLLDGLPRDDPRRAGIEQIALAGEKGSALTGQLLAFSRHQTLELRVLDLNAAVAGVEPMLRRVIGEDVELVTDLAADLGNVRADPNQLGQVVLNLAVNARDAMPRGGTLTLRTERVELDRAYAEQHRGASVRPGTYVMLSVSDTGEGMDEETQAQIFEPFFTTKEAGKGTGLGLSTVYGIARQSGGFVWVYSERGQGTTFKFYLPLVAEEAEAGEARDEPPEPDSTRGSETVLLVEDDETVRRLVRRILASNGYTVLEAGSGAEALDICDSYEHEIPLAVSDVVMSGISGFELGEQLRARRPEMRLLFMSGYTEQSWDDPRRTFPHAAFIEKPFSSTALARKVRRLLDGA